MSSAHLKIISKYLFELILVLLLTGCGNWASHKITSSPPGATIYIYYDENAIEQSRDQLYQVLDPAYMIGRQMGIYQSENPNAPLFKPSSEDMKKIRPFPIINTPYTMKTPWPSWYQVRKEGYDYSEIILLEGRGKSSYHFVLKNSAVKFVNNLYQAVLKLNNPNGISNNSDTKVEIILQAVDEINEDNQTATIKTLGEFINAVNEQRGDKLSEEDASSLIEKAQQIIDMLRND